MYKELEKYATNKKMNSICILPDKQEITIQLDVYEAKLGDLIEDFINHKRKPWWKRKYYHNNLTKLYKEILNELTIRHGF